MINAERILITVDGQLDHEVQLVIYGRAAIALGFENPPDAVKHTLDVDAIIPLSRIEIFRSDENFWDAQEGTNRELRKDGLYFTHLFEADQIFLRRDWEEHLVACYAATPSLAPSLSTCDAGFDFNEDDARR